MIAIVGIGRTGSKVAKSLANKKLLLIDRDIVEKHDIRKFYSLKHIGMPKALAAKNILRANAYAEELTRKNISLLENSKIIIDCTDNMETRFLLGEYCKKKNKILIHTAASRDKGVVAIFYRKPCFNCVYQGKKNFESCDGRDINEIVVNSIRRIVKKILQNPERFYNSLFRITNRKISRINIKENKKCNVCSGKYKYLNRSGKKIGIKIRKMCGKGIWEFRAKPIKEEFKIINDKITVFHDGRVLVKAETISEAKKIAKDYKLVNG